MQTLFGDTNDIHQLDFVTDYTSIVEKIQHINPIKYAKTRNFINGAVTYLSPYISRGVINTKQIKDAVLAEGFKPYQIEKFLQELAWREYYQRVWQAKKEMIWEDLKQPQPNVAHHQMPVAIKNAATGIEAIDMQIKNLYATGYLHNHVRMYVASITCNIGRAHWRQPAEWLYYHLLDGDIASNNCSWQWVAGAFASKKYYCNQENINKYTFSEQQHGFLDKSYDELPSMPVPEVLQSNYLVSLSTLLPQTTLPEIDVTKPTIIYNSYNLDPKWREGDDVNRVLLLEPSHFDRYPVSEKVLNFIMGLSTNIKGIQLYTGELTAIEDLYSESVLPINEAIIAKEHPLFNDYRGIKDSRDWMFPEVTGYYPSFFNYWKKCEQLLN
jgi:deoxyribodipyrimidine photo-lyase